MGSRVGTGGRGVVDEHRFLAEATVALASSLDYEATLARIPHLAVPPLADWCSVDLLERDGAVRRIGLACVDSLKHVTAEVGLAYPPDPEGRHPRTQVLRTGRAILVRDVTDDMLVAITDPEHLPVMRALGYRSAVIVPLIARGEIRGALTLATVERRYNERDLALAEELARRASIAVDNARLYRDAQEEIARRRAAERRLAAQHVATRALAEAGTFTDACTGILRALGEVLGWEWAALWVVDAAAGVLRCTDVWSAPSSAFPAFEAASRGRAFPPGVGLPGRVWASREPAWITDVVVDDNFPRSPIALREGLHTGIGFPFVVAGAIVGVMEFFGREVREPDPALLDMLATVGSQVGLFLERKRADDAVRESEARKSAILEAALDSIVTIDAEGRVTEFNPAAERTFGYRRADAIGREMAELIVPPALRERHRAGLGRFLRDGTGPVIGRRLEMPAMRADGSEFPVEIAIMRIASAGPPMFTGYLRDITERKRAEEERNRLLAREREAREQAESANQAKDDFLATVSHELRTPLTPILSWAGMLRRRTLDAPTTARALEAIERNARVQKQLVEDLLDISRIITGRMRLDVRPVELAPVVQAAIEAVSPAAEARSVRLETALDPDASVVVGDADRLQQVAWNLLSNAIKFTPEGGRVDVRLARRGAHVELSVADTGRGIAAELLPHVFERFWQADATSTRRHGGLGLGLAIVRHLVELHGGSVAVESAGEGRGTTFRVTLPRLAARAGDAAAERAEPEGGGDAVAYPRLEGLRVLVVDDEPDTAEMLRTLLAECGAEVRMALSAAEALRIVDGWTPSVLLSDIAMPDQDGYALIERIRALDPARGGRVPAIALTAYARNEDRVKATAAGFQVHLPKPVEPAELLAAVARLAARS